MFHQAEAKTRILLAQTLQIITDKRPEIVEAIRGVGIKSFSIQHTLNELVLFKVTLNGDVVHELIEANPGDDKLIEIGALWGIPLEKSTSFSFAVEQDEMVEWAGKGYCTDQEYNDLLAKPEKEV
jgi:hypothetical protein